MEIYNQMVELLKEVEGDVQKYYEKGNKAAGTRIRKAMQNLKALAQEQRTDISDKNKTEA
jgi:hypothetical protein